MAGTRPTTRFWFVILSPNEARIRCSHQRRGQRIVQFTVQLEVRHLDSWQPTVRYDNAHGFCHRDTLHADGTQDKTPVSVGDVNETFTYAVDDLKNSWEAHWKRFLKEIGP